MMRFLDLTEAIPNRPRNLGAYLDNRIKALISIRARLAQAQTMIKQNIADGEPTFNYAIKYGAPDELKDVVRQVYEIEHANLDNAYCLKDLQRNLETYKEHRSAPAHDFLRYIFSTLDYVRPISDEVRRAFSLLAYAESGFMESGYKTDDTEPEYLAAKNLLVAYRIIAACLPQIETLQQDIKTKLGVIRDLKGHYDAGKYRPSHDEIETLYHATAFMGEIIRDGFHAAPPEGRRGLGNYGHQTLISFTHDLEIARNIMRALKEMWLIAHGQLTGNTIMKWAQAEGITDEMLRGWKNWSSRPGPWSRAAAPQDVAYLYRIWLAHSKLRSDPMMTYPDKVIDMLQDRTLQDIGVLACQVRLAKDDHYLYGESEFRLTSDRVISIKRVF